MTSPPLAPYLIEQQVVMFELDPNWFRFGQAIAVLQMGIRMGLIAPEESNALRQRIDFVADQLPVEGTETNKLDREHTAADLIKQTMHELEQIPATGSSSEEPPFMLYVFQAQSGEMSGHMYRAGEFVFGVAGCVDEREVIEAAEDQLGTQLDLLRVILSRPPAEPAPGV